jgi:outer membrane protein assembly factor BamB
MLGKIMAILAVAASFVVAGMGPAAAGGKAARAASENSPWFQTDAGFTASRANHTEHVLTPATVAKARFLRGVVSPPTTPNTNCGGGTAAPVLVGGYLYLVTDLKVSKYNAATGKLIWRRTPDPTFDTDYLTLSISGNGLLVVDGIECDSASEPYGLLYAYNAATGKLVWSATNEGLYQAVVANGYVVTSGADAAGSFSAVLNVSNGKTVWERIPECGDAPPPPGD